MPSRRLLGKTLIPVALGVAAVLAGCHGSSPTSPSQTLVFDGNLAFGQTTTEPVSLSRVSNMRVALTDLHPLLVDVTTLDPASLTVNLGLGTLASDGTCVVTTRQLLPRSAAVSFGLDAGNWCLTITDSGLLPQGSTEAYQLQVEITD